jgi:ribosomal protein L37AE/L43A
MNTEEAVEIVKNEVVLKPTNIIKCGNCDYTGQGEKARPIWAVVLAWLCFIFGPMITLVYFVVSHKWRCPKCKSTFVGVRNKKGVLVGSMSRSMKFLLIFLAVIFTIFSFVVFSSISVSRSDAKKQLANKEIAKKEFVTSCATDPSKKAYCSCAFDKMINKIGKNGIIAVFQNFNTTGKLDAGIVDLLSSCVK